MVLVDESYIDTASSAIAMIANLRDNRDIDGNVSEVQLERLLANLMARDANGPVPLEIKAQNAGIVITRHGRTFELRMC